MIKVGESFELLDKFALCNIVSMHVLLVFFLVENGDSMDVLMQFYLLDQGFYLFVHLGLILNL